MHPRLFSWLCALAGFSSFVRSTDADETHAGDIKGVPLRTHSLSAPYLDSDMQNRWFDFGGDSYIKTDSFFRLTADRPSQAGWIFSRVPLTATNWEIEVEFKIHGRNQLFGDGFAMWLTKGRAQQGEVFGNVNRFEGLGIFIDTYKNNRPGVVFPYVMAMVGDGNKVYDKGNDGKDQEFAGCSARGIRNSNKATMLRLTYFQEKQLMLQLQYRNENEWLVCFNTTSPPVLPAVTYLGFSAETGELSDHHDIIQVSARNLYRSVPPNPAKAPVANQKANSEHFSTRADNTGWGWFIIKICLLMLVVGGAYSAWVAFRVRNSRPY